MNTSPGCSMATPEIEASLMISESGCVIGINTQASSLSYAWHGSRLFASDGREIRMPQDRVKSCDAIKRIMDLVEHDAESVFVCEFGPYGPVAEHPIDAMAWKKL